MTSFASISTQSAVGRPSIRTERPNSALIFSASFIAIEATCRVERPLAITMKSAIEDLPASGIEIVSHAWSSSSDARIRRCSASTSAGSDGRGDCGEVAK